MNENTNSFLKPPKDSGRANISRPLLHAKNWRVPVAQDIPMSTDHHIFKNSERCVTYEPIAKASIQTENGKVKMDFLDITALIRSIQRAEGNPGTVS